MLSKQKHIFVNAIHLISSYRPICNKIPFKTNKTPIRFQNSFIISISGRKQSMLEIFGLEIVTKKKAYKTATVAWMWPGMPITPRHT